MNSSNKKTIKTKTNENNKNNKNEEIKEVELKKNKKVNKDIGSDENKNEIKNKEEKIKKLKKRVNDLQVKVDELNDKYLRSIAENRNMNLRLKKEYQQLLNYDGQKLAGDILPIVDDLNRAINIDKSGDDDQLRKGIEMIYKNINKVLKDHDIIEIKAKGKKFDPKFHQAIQTIPKVEGQEEDVVVNVLQKGYMFKDRVLRPAMVVVSQ